MERTQEQSKPSQDLKQQPSQDLKQGPRPKGEHEGAGEGRPERPLAAEGKGRDQGDAPQAPRDGQGAEPMQENHVDAAADEDAPEDAQREGSDLDVKVTDEKDPASQAI